jgi:hypothetical protein
MIARLPEVRQKMVMRKVVIYMICILVVLQLGMSVVNWRKSELQPENRQEQTHFDGNRALNDVEFQVALGPRIPGSPGHNRIIEWLVSELESTEWQVEIQEAEMLGNPIKKRNRQTK